MIDGEIILNNYIQKLNEGDDKMHEKFISWLNDLNTDCDIDRLRIKLHRKKIELLHIRHQLSKQEELLNRIKSDYNKTKVDYEQLDLDLALIDGRYFICEPQKEKRTRTIRTREDRILDKLKDLSKTDREHLMSELSKLIS